MDFEESAMVSQIKTMVDEFIEREIEPLEEEYDHFLGEDAEFHIIEGTGSDYIMCEEFLDLWQEIRELSTEAGIYTLHMPEEIGGEGMSTLALTKVIEYIETRDPDGFHSLTWDIDTVTKMMLPAYENERTREQFFEPMMNGEKTSAFAMTEPNHGSDATFMDTSAEKYGDEWVINGQKAFVTKGAIADFHMVTARTSGEDGSLDGITTFLVDADNRGLSVDKVQRPMGGLPGEQAILSYTDCRVPEDQVLGEIGEGFSQITRWLADGRLTVASSSVGRAQWLLDTTVEYAKERNVFEQPIWNYQGIKFPLAEMATEIQQSRLLYQYAAWKTDQGESAIQEQSMSKLKGTEVWNEAADLAVQVHGGSGFMRSLPIEEAYRESRAARIYDGTDEIQKRTIARFL